MTFVTQPAPIALTIAGFDPSSGAGLTADLKTFSAHGIYGVGCISALTVQSTLGVRRVQPLSAALVRETLQCLVEDVQLSGVKIGMLGNSEVANEVASFLRSQAGAIAQGKIVLDPVLRSSSGAPLIDPEGIRVIREELLPQLGWITPNIAELMILIGEDQSAGEPLQREQVSEAAVRLQEIAIEHGNRDLNVVVTGGHLRRPDDFVLTASGQEHWLPGERIVTNASHGTGCAFSSALLCGLIAGLHARDAAIGSKLYVTEALRSAYPVGKGKGPMNHFFGMSPK